MRETYVIRKDGKFLAFHLGQVTWVDSIEDAEFVGLQHIAERRAAALDATTLTIVDVEEVTEADYSNGQAT